MLQALAQLSWLHPYPPGGFHPFENTRSTAVRTSRGTMCRTLYTENSPDNLVGVLFANKELNYAIPLATVPIRHQLRVTCEFHFSLVRLRRKCQVKARAL